MSDTDQTEKVIHKTTIQVVVLSGQSYTLDDLYQLHFDITDGDCSGDFEVVDTEELTGQRAIDAIEGQGSDPEFFGIKEDDDEDENG